MTAGELARLLQELPPETPVVIEHRILSHLWLEKRCTLRRAEPGACGECGTYNFTRTGEPVDVPAHVGLSGRVVGPHFRDDPLWDPGVAFGGRWPRSTAKLRTELERRPR